MTYSLILETIQNMNEEYETLCTLDCNTWNLQLQQFVGNHYTSE